MPPPTREQVNALIETCDRAVELATRLTSAGPKAANVSCSEMHEISEFIHEAVPALTALQAENDRLRAQASPAWVALSERKPTKEDGDEQGYVLWHVQPLGFCAVYPWDWNSARSIEYWQRLPAPPESAADRQRREDEEAMKKAICGFAHPADLTFCAGFRAALRHARKEATP